MKALIVATVLVSSLSGRAVSSDARTRGWYCSSFTVEGHRDAFCEREQERCLEALSALTQAELKRGRTLQVVGNACFFRAKAYVTSYYMGPGALKDAGFPDVRSCRMFSDEIKKTTFPITRTCALAP